MKKEVELARWGKKLQKLLEQYKYVMLVILVGVILLLLPTGKKAGDEHTTAEGMSGTAANEEHFQVEAMEKKLEEALSEIEGAGKVKVVLTVQGGNRQVLAQDGKRTQQENAVNTVVISKGSGSQDTVVLQELYPQYQGALIICSGGGNMSVKLKLVEAVSALTGLGADKIAVCKSN